MSAPDWLSVYGQQSIGYDDWIQAVGRDRLLLGFSGASGALKGHIVRHIVGSSWMQPTMFGELGRARP